MKSARLRCTASTFCAFIMNRANAQLDLSAPCAGFIAVGPMLLAKTQERPVGLNAECRNLYAVRT